MSNIKKFVDQIKADAALRTKVTSLAGDDITGLMALANEAGFPFSIDEYNKHQRVNSGELSDDQLDNVSGGASKLTKSSRVVIRID